METALFGLLGAIIGSAVTTLVAMLREERVRDRRSTELATAFHAEISAGSIGAAQQAEPQNQEVLRELAEGPTPDDDAPFGLPDAGRFVLENHQSELTLLPAPVIHAVVLYYRIARQTDDYVVAFRSEDFRNLPPHRRRKFVDQYLDLNDEMRFSAETALNALRDYVVSRGADLPAAMRVPRPEPPSTSTPPDSVRSAVE